MAGELSIALGNERHVIESTTAFVVGRSPVCDLVIDDGQISREHLEIAWVGTAWHVADLGSANGTFHHGSQINDLTITSTTELTLGGPSGPKLELTPINAMLAGPTGRKPTVESTAPGTERSQLAAELMTHNIAVVHRLAVGESVDVGREPGVGVLVDDPIVSRRHCTITRLGEQQYVVNDAGSSNGTFVAGVRATPSIECRSGDVVEIGNSDLLISVDGGLFISNAPSSLSFVVRDLRFEANGRCWLNDVSLQLPPNSLTAVLGPSGAGKSTLVTTMLGIQTAAGGTVHYGGKDLLGGGNGRLVGYVPQGEIVHPQLKVKEALHFAARIRLPTDTTKQEIDARVSKTLEALGIGKCSDQRVSDLSGGQRRRVSTAVELISKPPLLLLDEPTSGLDPGNEHVMMRELQELAHDEEEGRRVIVVTHSMESLHLCDGVIIMAPGTSGDEGGRMVFHGSPDQIEQYFGVAHKSQVFTEIEHGDMGGFASRIPEVAPAANVVPRARTAEVRTSNLNWFQQVWLLLRRSLRIISSDRAQLFLLAAQAPVLGLLLAAISGGAFDPEELPSQRVVLLLLGSILAMVFVGGSNAVREIVRERPNADREHALGIRWSSYMTAKFLPLAFIGIVQAFLVVFAATAWQSGLDSQTRLSMTGIVALSGLGAIALGLLLSALSQSVDKALGLLPMILLGMYLVSGGPADIDAIPVLQQLSWVNSARWGLDGLFAVADGAMQMGCTDSVGEFIDGSPCRTSWVGGGVSSLVGRLLALILAPLAAGVVVLNRQSR